MTRLEVIGIIEFIRRAYPRFIEPSILEPDIEKTVSGVVDLWSKMFRADPLNIVMAAVEYHIQTNKFPPTIADIRSIITDKTMQTVTPGEIWEECHRLLNSGISPEAPEIAYSRMTDVCRKATLAVGGWYSLSMSPENDPYIRKTFFQAAQNCIQRNREQGIPFDRAKMNTLIPRSDAARLLGAVNG